MDDEEEQWPGELTPDQIEIVEAAKTELSRAIHKCLNVMAEVNGEVADMYIDGWVLFTHKRTIELEKENTSAVGYLHPTGQAWPLTVGLAKLGLNQVQ